MAWKFCLWSLLGCPSATVPNSAWEREGGNRIPEGTGSKHCAQGDGKEHLYWLSLEIVASLRW